MSRINDAEFEQRVQETIERYRPVLERLAQAEPLSHVYAVDQWPDPTHAEWVCSMATFADLIGRPAAVSSATSTDVDVRAVGKRLQEGYTLWRNPKQFPDSPLVEWEYVEIAKFVLDAVRSGPKREARLVECATCRGSGKNPGVGNPTCPACHGTCYVPKVEDDVGTDAVEAIRALRFPTMLRGRGDPDSEDLYHTPAGAKEIVHALRAIGWRSSTDSASLDSLKVAIGAFCEKEFAQVTRRERVKAALLELIEAHDSQERDS